jgi:hypothetical protein
MTNTKSAVDAVEALADWSENCEHPTPYALFLDLIGWSEEEYGCRLCSEAMPKVGYVEAFKLGQALEAWADHPREVEEHISDRLTNLVGV